eukprot:1137666-Pelagomonas_calceolata.AAC.1
MYANKLITTRRALENQNASHSQALELGASTSCSLAVEGTHGSSEPICLLILRRKEHLHRQRRKKKKLRRQRKLSLHQFRKGSHIGPKTTASGVPDLQQQLEADSSTVSLPAKESLFLIKIGRKRKSYASGKHLKRQLRKGAILGANRLIDYLTAMGARSRDRLPFQRLLGRHLLLNHAESSIPWGFRGVGSRRAAVKDGKRRVWAPSVMADNSLDPH